MTGSCFDNGFLLDGGVAAASENHFPHLSRFSWWKNMVFRLIPLCEWFEWGFWWVCHWFSWVNNLNEYLRWISKWFWFSLATELRSSADTHRRTSAKESPKFHTFFRSVRPFIFDGLDRPKNGDTWWQSTSSIRSLTGSTKQEALVTQKGLECLIFSIQNDS